MPPARRSQLFALIQRDPRRRWDRDGLAAALGISGLHLSRQLKATFGMPLRRWLVEMRIRSAAQELEAGDTAIAEIARRHGYEDQFLFSRQFRAVLGTTPRAWRERS
jgi:AraC-like DNA-binding protein